jgi:hypothetical protein
VHSFPSDEDGLYNKEGEVAKGDMKLHVKYVKEGRFSFGIASVKLPDGAVNGRRCKTFD